jgi:hypothetical protein
MHIIKFKKGVEMERMKYIHELNRIKCLEQELNMWD